MIAHQRLDSLASFRTFLHLVENNHRLPLLQHHIVDSLQPQKDVVQVIQIVEQRFHLCRCLGEIN
jgi:hypothetical protein